MSNDLNADEPRYCGECEHCHEIPWRYYWKGQPYRFACFKSDDTEDIVLVTEDMEACGDWRPL